MRRVAIVVGTLALANLLASGCTKPPATPPPKVEAPPPPPPPPPKCESLDEKCLGAEGKRARIGPTDLGVTFAPPKGWTYAQGAESTVATTASAALAVGFHEVPKKLPAAEKVRTDTFAALAKSVSVEFKKSPRWPKKPDKIVNAGGLELRLYQFEGASREKKGGSVLAFTSKLAGDRSLVGLGFVAQDDTGNEDAAILAAIESFQQAEKEHGAPVAADAGTDAAPGKK